MCKKILIYYPFPLPNNQDSGSKVRPAKMVSALSNWAYENNVKPIVIAGTSSERADQINSLVKETNISDILFCYVENQTIPLWLTDPNHIPSKPFTDYTLFKNLKENHVPIGIFYRDMYWKFDDVYEAKGIKRFILRTLYKIEERFFSKYGNVLFLPSMEMAPYLDTISLKKVLLPPGCTLAEKSKVDTEKMDSPNAIYIGGISPRYGLEGLLSAFEKVNKHHNSCKLTLICRKSEFDALPEETKERMIAPHITLVHASGEELKPYLQNASFGIIPIKKTDYNDFAIPVKLFEYLSYELPVVATNLNALTTLVEDGDFGIITEDNGDSLARGVTKMIEQYPQLAENAKEASTHHTWDKRAEQVANSLLKFNEFE